MAEVQERRHPHLTLHCGAAKVERQQVMEVETPRATGTWTPIAHMELVERVESTLEANGLKVGEQAHSLTKDGARYFGLMEVQREDQGADDYCWVLGLRNSHDKKFPAGVIAGSSVFICDNLCFSGEVKLARKHTRFIGRDLPSLVQGAIGKLMSRWHHEDERIQTYKLTNLQDSVAHDLMIRALDVGVIPNREISKVLDVYRHPQHEEFQPRNLWSFSNAFTEVLKGNLNELPKRTEALYGLLDNHAGLALPA